ncbi:MAG: catechol 1,2-dioxygenase [Actinomycetota bacterium]|nr:catechol 1,2-dioxygenase [Actinomycetota bacterium]
MARIVLGAGASHSTLMNTHWDQVRHVERAERFRDALADARDAVATARPDVAIVVGSNHFRGFWLDMIPAFTLGVGEVVGAGEAGTPKGPQRTDPAFARALAGELVDRGTEVAISARLQIDHGQTHAIQYLLTDLDVPVVPLVINAFAAPLPRIDRCVQLGRNLADAAAAIPDDLRVVVIASGGLSHQLPWPADWREPQNADEEFLVEAWLNGRGEWERYDKRRREIITAARPTIFEEFDEAFLADLEAGRLDRYAAYSSVDIGKAAGNGGQELRTWLTMAAALGFAPGRRLAYSAMPEWLTGMGVALIEPVTEAVS